MVADKRRVKPTALDLGLSKNVPFHHVQFALNLQLDDFFVCSLCMVYGEASHTTLPRYNRPDNCDERERSAAYFAFGMECR
jgi:hypothetical protein